MTLFVPDGYGLVVHSILLNGDPEPMAVTYGIEVEATADPQVVATECRNAFAPVMEQMSDQYRLNVTEVLLQKGPSSVPPEVGINATQAIGTDNRPPVPQNTAFLIKKRSSVAGRSGGGRFYLPGVVEAAVDAIGQVEPVFLGLQNARLVTMKNALLSAPQTNGMVILHDSLSAAAVDPPHTVTSLVMDARVATQRRRLRR